MFKIISGLLLSVAVFWSVPTAASDHDALMKALDGTTPLIDDLEYLTDKIGGRATGTAANTKAVDWIAERLRAAGLQVTTPEFNLPRSWIAEESYAIATGPDFSFRTHFVPRVYSAQTQGEETAPLYDVGAGEEADFARLDAKVKGAFVLVHTPILSDDAGLDGLFGEYVQSYHAKTRAAYYGAKGVIYISSRPKGLMMRHVAIKASENTLVTATIDRENGLRLSRALENSDSVSLTVNIKAEDRPGGTARNIIAEIPGSEHPEEIVLIGAHMDSHDLGTGALDNGTNTVIVMDIARQIMKTGIKPKRTIRFALWNAEEYGMLGSGAYVAAHMNEMDQHIVTITHDIGAGAITGYFTNGDPALLEETNAATAQLFGRGPFSNFAAPLVGTDNYDFMMIGVPNLVANQDAATYPSNYHAQSDTFDKVDLRQLKANAAIAGSTIWHFANTDWKGTRATAEDITQMVEDNQLHAVMDGFGLLDAWLAGKRGLNVNAPQ